ncbi:MAG: tRNA preQ1(34) S-adenosylmethionine ribosyltransferase-isomerase QueA [Pirellulaceae bacterium]|nr:tRNA preQ1(34) S-adenosylmethionine ribosyltransferase-isomerase QueA [Pirellulaceae bacterium]
MTSDLELVEHYDYELPKSLIAQYPLPQRDESRLMVVNRQTGEIEHRRIRELPAIIAPGDLMVLNDSRVIPAKLVGLRQRTGGRWQGLFLEEENGIWKVLSKTRGKLEPNEEVVLQDRQGSAHTTLVMLSKLADGSWLARPQSELTSFTLLEAVGRVPLPQYIRDGKMVDDDLRRYQTVYASKPGSVAAPTAGLHLTKPLIEELIDTQKFITRVTLHVGIGTFKPMASRDINDHQMHHEWAQIDEKAIDQINRCRTEGKRIIAVGSTACRVLETVGKNQPLSPWVGETNLFIRPGHQFALVDGLLTNFHLPKSTLLVLVRTFGGDELIKRAYEMAIQERYRFFSYGDAMLIL